MKLYGIYKAIVLDNSDYFKTGKLWVKIDFLNLGEPLKTFDGLNADQYKKELMDSAEHPCLLFSPFGGGENNGAVSIPMNGSTGVVQFINGDLQTPVWMGTIYEPKRDSSGKTTINIPNDDPDIEGDGNNGVQDYDGQNGKKLNDETQYIFRTKTNKRPLGANGNFDLDFSRFGAIDDSKGINNLTTNMTLWQKTKMIFRHFGKWSKQGKNIKLNEYTELSFDTNNGTIKLTSYFMNAQNKACSNEIFVDKDKINLTIEDKINSVTNMIDVNRNEVFLQSKRTANGPGGGLANSTIIIVPDSTTISSNGSNVIIQKDSVIVSSSKNIQLSPGKDGQINLASGDGYVVVAPNPLWSVQASDGSMAVANPKLRG